MDVVRHLLEQERQFRQRECVAPLVGNRLRLRLDGLLHTLKVRAPAGWGRFRIRDAHHADYAGKASPAEIETYHETVESVCVRLVHPIEGNTWLGVRADGHPLVVRLVEGGTPFAAVRAGWDGTHCWYRDLDPAADPRIAEGLRKGRTPADRLAFWLAQKPATDEERLRRALSQGGARLQSYVQRGDHWNVTYTDSRGHTHTSAIALDLSVISSGICLSGEDRKFDLTSLIGVLEDAD